MYAEQIGALFNTFQGFGRKGPNCGYFSVFDPRGYIHLHPDNRVTGAVMHRIMLKTLESILAGSELVTNYGRMFTSNVDGEGDWEHHKV